MFAPDAYFMGGVEHNASCKHVDYYYNTIVIIIIIIIIMLIIIIIKK